MPELFAAIGRLDVAVFRWLQHHHLPFVDPVMAGLSDLARGGALWIGLGALAAVMRPSRWPAVLQLVLAIVVCTNVTDRVAKPLFDRARPFEQDAATAVRSAYRPTTRSFPSGHAANAIAGAYALARLAPEARAIFWLLGLAVALSRVWLGVHYPADIVGGALLGWAVAAVVIGGTRWRPANDV